VAAGTPARPPKLVPGSRHRQRNHPSISGIGDRNADARAPTALGLKATVNVHDACVSIEPEQGLAPLGVTMNSPLLVIAGTSE